MGYGCTSGTTLIGAEAVAGTRLLLPHHWTLPVDLSGTATQGTFLSSFDSSFPQFGSVTAGDQLPYVPQFQGSGTVALERPGLRLGVETTARSGMFDTAAAPDEAYEVPALVLLNAAAHVQLREGWEAYLTSANLTNRKTVVSWRPFGARPTAPLQVFVGVKWTAGKARPVDDKG